MDPMYSSGTEPERVDVGAIFNERGLTPRVFRQGGRDYRIKKVNMVYPRYENGRDKVITFYVTDENDETRRLSYHEKNKRWFLEQDEMVGPGFDTRKRSVERGI